MAKQFAHLEPAHRAFIARQKIFFMASAAGGRVNLSPKDGKSLRVLDERRVAYLDQTGSGNETAAHTLAGGVATMMFCAFDGLPLILRLYGRTHVHRLGSTEYATLLADVFGGDQPPGARQIVVLEADLVQTSCGYGVPLFDYAGERDNLIRWAEHQGPEGMDAYRQQKNLISIDGLPTGW